MGNKKTRAEPEPEATSTQVTRGSGSEVRFYSAGADANIQRSRGAGR